MSLEEWAEGYLHHRDIFERKIVSIEREGTLIHITKKDGKMEAVIAERLEERILPSLKGTALLVTRNLAENLAFLTAHWESFAKLDGLKIVFVHEKSGEKWLLVPAHHTRIADPESLELGLKAMFEAVPEG